MVATRTADRPHGSGSCDAPQRAEERRPTGTEDRRQSQGGEGASYARRPTGTDGSSTGGAARHPRGAWAAEERPHRAALLRGQPADPRPALSGRVGRRGCGLLRAPLPHGPGAGGQEEGGGGEEEAGAGGEGVQQAVAGTAHGRGPAWAGAEVGLSWRFFQKEEEEEEEEKAAESLLLSAATWCLLFGEYFLGSAVDTVHASVAGAFGYYFTHFCVKVDIGSWKRWTFLPRLHGRARRRLQHWHVHGCFTGLLLELRSLLFSSGPRCSVSWPV